MVRVRGLHTCQVSGFLYRYYRTIIQ